MLLEFIQSNETFQIIVQLGIILLALRFFLMAVVIFALIAIKIASSIPGENREYINDRISHQSTTDIIFFQFFRVKTKPFLLKMVY